MESAAFDEKYVRDYIDKRKWTDFLRRFIEVLKINIFMVDASGRMLVPPYHEGERPRYGSQFLTQSFNFDFSGNRASLLADFQDNGSYWECADPFDFRTFAIPIKITPDKAIAYLIVGPVVLNKKWEHFNYINLANQLNINLADLESAIHEIRVVSFITIKSILDLLSEVVKDIVQLNVEMKSLRHDRASKERISKKFAAAARDIYETIHQDEFLITVLDLAISLSEAEGGSIMVLDEEKNELSIKVSKGLDPQKIQNIRQKLGDGIAGAAAKENISFSISGVSGDNRIQKYLNRPDLSQSLIMPLAMPNKQVFGVLNLHTKSEGDKLLANEDKLRQFLVLISTALQYI